MRVCVDCGFGLRFVAVAGCLVLGAWCCYCKKKTSGGFLVEVKRDLGIVIVIE